MRTLDPWTVVNTRCDAETLARCASVFAVTNGYFALRGDLAQWRSDSWPGTFIHGVYDEIDQFGTLRLSAEERRYLDPAWFESAGKSPAIANLPSPLLLRLFVDDVELALPPRRTPERPRPRQPHGARRRRRPAAAGDSPPVDPAAADAATRHARVAALRQELDLRTGVYRYVLDHVDALGRTTRIESQRFVPLRYPHRAYERCRIVPLDYDAPLRIQSGIDGRVRSNATGERQFEILAAAARRAGCGTMHVRTPARGHDVRLAVCTTPAGEAAPERPVRGVVEHEAVYAEYEFAGRTGRGITLDRCIVATSSEDARHGVAVEFDPELEAAAALGFDAALEQQREDWAALWERADVRIEGDDLAQRYLRFCLYHLLAAAPRHSDRLSVPCKLLSGEGYQGNTFYDTDLYIVPFYTFTFPELARTCLNYRCHGLRYGRQIADELGYEGAKLAWQAGPYGEECLGRWYRFTQTNIHINADVAYSLMQYHHATDDEAFMAERGVALLVETARFYASRGDYDPQRQRYVLAHVAGPDEAHCDSTANFYTNYLVQRHLRWAADALDRLRQRDEHAWAYVCRRLQIAEDEPRRWREIADRLVLPFDPQTRVVEQFEGFYQLDPVPDDLLEERRDWFAPVSSYQAINQPDVVMALALFCDDFDEQTLRANWEFYKPRSMNFSSMSHAINAIMAARLGEVDDAYRQFIITAGMDLDPTLTGRGDTAEGLHGTALGGAWLAVVLGFAGVSPLGPTLRIEPRLPRHWKTLRFKLVLRGEVFEVTIDAHEVAVRGTGSAAVAIPAEIAGHATMLRGGQELRVPRAPRDAARTVQGE